MKKDTKKIEEWIRLYLEKNKARVEGKKNGHLSLLKNYETAGSTNLIVGTLKNKIEKEKRYIKYLDNISPKKELATILQNKAIKEIIVQDDLLQILTKPLIIMELQCGEYLIKIEPSSISNCRIINATVKIPLKISNYTDSELRHHPHVMRFGEPCLGEWSKPLQEYFDSGAIALLVDTWIHFLLHISSHGYEPYLRQWHYEFSQFIEKNHIKIA